MSDAETVEKTIEWALRRLAKLALNSEVAAQAADIAGGLQSVATLHAQAVAALEEELRELRADIAELTAAMAESEPRLMAEHAAVLACIPFVNLCRRWFDGTDLHISRAALHEDEPEIGELLRVAARALDATRGFLP
jgi:hypothetical protein